MALFSVNLYGKRRRKFQLSLEIKSQFMGYLNGKHDRYSCSVFNDKWQNRVLLTLPFRDTETSSLMLLKRGNLYPKDSWHGTAESLFRASVKDSDAISCNSRNRTFAKKSIYRMRMVQGEERAKFFSSLRLNAFF